MSTRDRPSTRADETAAGKLPGKTEFSGRRRSATRTSGHHSHPESTGGEFREEQVDVYPVDAGEAIELAFSAPGAPSTDGSFMAFGAWFTADVELTVKVTGLDASRRLTQAVAQLPDWGKVGSMWPADGRPLAVTVSIRAAAQGRIAVREPGCGLVSHRYLIGARPALLRNMWEIAPEANFYVAPGQVVVRRRDGTPLGPPAGQVALPLKSCNRCARFLPINLQNERLHLSFSNHCVAAHRRPCRHAGFGRLRDVETGETRQLEYGYQLECRFCKKFEVNAAHNKQRTAAQMKEDAARRRSIELLLTELYGESPQLRFRHEHPGHELADFVWHRFGKRCFNCGVVLATAKKMHLDHTRPLALMWPLDGSATALCGSCNSKKRDRAPAEFYTVAQLEALADATKVPFDELRDPSPNTEAVELLRDQLDWFFDEFLTSPLLVKERDGKTAAELLVKALQKTINKCPAHLRFDLEAELERRRGPGA